MIEHFFELRVLMFMKLSGWLVFINNWLNCEYITWSFEPDQIFYQLTDAILSWRSWTVLIDTKALAKKREYEKMIHHIQKALSKYPVDLTMLSLLKCSLQEKLETLRIQGGEITDIFFDDKIEQADVFRRSKKMPKCPN